MKLTIFRKLILGFAVIVILAVVLSLFQLAKFRGTLALLDSIASNDTRVYATVASIAKNRAVLQSRREAAISAAALAGGVSDPEGIRPLLDAYRVEARQAVAAVDRLTALTAELTGSGVTGERRDLWRDLNQRVGGVGTLLRDIAAETDRMFEALAAGRIQEATAARQTVNEMSTRAERELEAMTATAERLTESGRNDIAATYDEVTMASVAAILLVVAAAAGAALLIGRSISVPLVRSIDMARRIGGGDLTGELPVANRDEIGELSGTLNQTAANLRQIATRTRAAAEDLNTSTAQIRASAQEQAAAVAEQLAAIEETSATLTEITQSGAHMSQRAQEVIAAAAGVSGAADQGLRAVEDTSAVMAAIREQVETLAENIVMLSQRTQAIGDIILTVNTIAERSHLLALNASIEAAAAGEHGRSFSVVAAEIKKLADQAKDATGQVRSNLGEIQQGINASVMLTEEAAKRVASGRTQTDAADRTIRRMTDSIQESVQAFQQIVAGINQHQIGLEQVMQALQNIRTASSQTAGTTRQLEAAAASMSGLSESLVGATRNYQV